MDLWNIPEAEQVAIAMRKFECIGATAVRLGARLSGIYRAIEIRIDGRWVPEMLYDTDRCNYPAR